MAVDPRDYVSTLAEINMDELVWRRQSGLPRGYFDRHWVTTDVVVYCACCIALAASLAAFIASAA